MDHRSSPVLQAAAAAAAALALATLPGCMQSLDDGVTAGSVGPPAQGGASTDGADSGGVDASDILQLPETPCTPGSEQCFLQCQSPACALPGGSLPAEFNTPIIFLPDGGTTPTSCDDVEANSMIIRQRSCTPCHDPAMCGAAGPCTQSPAPSSGFVYNFILDDTELVTTPLIANPDGGDNLPLVIPGNPAASALYLYPLAGLASNNGVNQTTSTEMPPAQSSAGRDIGADAAAAIVYPTASDLSVLYEWIQDCVQAGDAGPSADGGANSIYNYSYGPGYAPTSSVTGGVDASVASAAGSDAGAQ